MNQCSPLCFEASSSFHFDLLFRALTPSLTQSLELADQLTLSLRTRSLEIGLSLALETLSLCFSQRELCTYCNRRSVGFVACETVAGRPGREPRKAEPRATSLGRTPPSFSGLLASSCRAGSENLTRHSLAVPEAARACTRSWAQKLRNKLARYNHSLTLPLSLFSRSRSARVMGCVRV